MWFCLGPGGPTKSNGKCYFLGRAGQGRVGHLSPGIARRLREALRDALAEMGEDTGR